MSQSNTTQSKARAELRQAAQKLVDYLDFVDHGVAEFDPNHCALNKTKDALRQVKFTHGLIPAQATASAEVPA